jgi:hypothetical protein
MPTPFQLWLCLVSIQWIVRAPLLRMFNYGCCWFQPIKKKYFGIKYLGLIKDTHTWKNELYCVQWKSFSVVCYTQCIFRIVYCRSYKFMLFVLFVFDLQKASAYAEHILCICIECALCDFSQKIIIFEYFLQKLWVCVRKKLFFRSFRKKSTTTCCENSA